MARQKLDVLSVHLLGHSVMNKQSVALRILVTLYRSASRGRFPSELLLAEQAGVEPKVLSELLLALEQAGYVDSARLRLTLPGLAVAVAAGNRQNLRSLARAA
jgi:DNA-binding IclR family transcriptional regulator